MAGEAIIAALLGAAGGAGGVRVLGRLVGPARTETVVNYQLKSLKASAEQEERLYNRIRHLESDNTKLLKRIEGLEDAVARIASGELPPEYS